jgi:hypothetical protein
MSISVTFDNACVQFFPFASRMGLKGDVQRIMGLQRWLSAANYLVCISSLYLLSYPSASYSGSKGSLGVFHIQTGSPLKKQSSGSITSVSQLRYAGILYVQLEGATEDDWE